MSLTGLKPKTIRIEDPSWEEALIKEGHKVMSAAAKKRKQEGSKKECETDRRTEATYIEVGRYNPTNPNKDIQNKGII